ncbi:MAG: hypothetical protein ACTSPY_15810, partial [Candidatus Helarchaeota archaeon]
MNNKSNKKIYSIFLLTLFTIGILSLYLFENLNTGLLKNENIDLMTDAKDYLGIYSFTNDAIGSNPAGWVENETGIADFHIIQEKDGHSNVYQLMSDSGTGQFSYTRNYFSNQSSGTIEFWVMDDGQGNGNLYLGLMESEYRIGHI